MAVLSLMVTKKIADDICYRHRNFDFRLKDKNIRVGDIIHYTAIHRKEIIPHEITGKRFGVIYVDNDDPRVHKHYSAFTFVEIEPEFE